jgi:hypothetical protein
MAKLLEAAEALGEAAYHRIMERLTSEMKHAPEMEENVMADLAIFSAQNPEQVMAAILAAVPALAAAGMGVEKIVQKIRGGAKDAAKAGEEAPTADDLMEALSTIETLRNDLNETNLLNAKLLYVNKVFKASNLSESQKASVIAAFDKAETVKEVKLVYETVSENVSSVGKKEVVREAKGFASAAAGISTKPGVITETNQAVLRMQKLAGIIK